MAQKRMFDKKVVCSDKFIDLPNSSKALYFMAGIEADDKGFFQPRSLQRLCGFSDDDFKILIAKGFFITFESGVMVVTDWNKNNWLDSRRVTETEYLDELRLLKLVNQKYEFDLENASAKPSLSQNRIEENSIEENSIEEYIGCAELTTSPPAMPSTFNDSDVAFKLPLNKKNDLFIVLKSELDFYKDLYPNVNIEQEFRKMIGWLDANPKKRKTRNGIKKFVNNWLSREQDKGHNNFTENKQTSTTKSWEESWKKAMNYCEE